MNAFSNYFVFVRFWWWQICYARIAEKSLNILLLLLILKSNNQRWSVKRGALKNFANFTGNHLCWSLFIIRSPATFFKRDFDTDILRWNLQSSEEYLFWRAIVNLCMLLYLHRCFSLQCMKRLWWRFTKTVNVF